ncbi:AAA family ATPase [Salinimonas lutimaris]|uniref:AAA family ATPase n=1 Tax=Salinimonas lutimaris TaxID=914153 RepID=UPI0010C00AF3|nr:AAA family ATPase [Salinimonas lutimaris]
MTKIVIFGNSGAGKSTLANRLSEQQSLAHLDLDTLAWQPVSPPVRRSVEESRQAMDEFVLSHTDWVIEGCYSDLLEYACGYATRVIYLCLPVQACIANARARPWEPHKYSSKEAQDANLAMLIDWISQYEYRTDTFSKAAHEALFDKFAGEKRRLTSNTPSL